MRKQRFETQAASGIYHVFGRGTDKRVIFDSPHYYARFLDRMLQYADEHSVDIRCYCLMPNHFHLLAHTEPIDRLSALMHRLLTAYAVFYNRRQDRSGHLFQSRFQSRPVETDRYYRHLLKYITENPHELGKLDRYPWLGGSALH